MPPYTPQWTRWCFTLNNPTDEEKAAVVLALSQPEFIYHVVAEETGEGGTPHLQGFFILAKHKKKSLKAVKEIPGFSRAHFDAAKGTTDQCDKYVRKGNVGGGGEGGIYHGKPYDGVPVILTEGGTKPKPPGAAGGDVIADKYAQAHDAAVAGDLDSIEDMGVKVRCYNSLKRLMEDNMARPDDLDEIQNVYIHGPPDTGKSHWARVMFPGCSVYEKDPHTKWWDGYSGEELVVMDDLDSIDRELFSNLKRWGDKYAFRAEVKGGYRFIRPRHFVITSQRPLSSNLSHLALGPADMDAVRRRFREVFLGERTNANPNPFMHGPAERPADPVE